MRLLPALITLVSACRVKATGLHDSNLQRSTNADDLNEFYLHKQRHLTRRLPSAPAENLQHECKTSVHNGR